MAEVVAQGRQTLADGFCLTEAPRWRNGRLYFSDVHGGKVHTVDLSGKVQTVVDFGSACSGIGFMPNGDMLVVRMAENTVVRVSGGQVLPHADLGAFADTEINDMVVGPTGRAYVTQLGPLRTQDAPAKRYTRIVIVEPDGSARVGFEGLQGPNGVALSEDGRTLVFSEAGGFRMSALDVSPSGDLSNLRTVAALPDGVCPDGMCLDAQGGAWAAAVVEIGTPLKPGPGFCRYDAKGNLTHTVTLEPDRHAVACAFGGEDRSVLFLCTDGVVTPAEAVRDRSARIERIVVPGFTGAGIP
jgi:sugar lactone lactonase YvrE